MLNLSLISITFPEISRENMDVHPCNMHIGIAVMRDGTLKLVKMQLANALSPMLSMPSWETNGGSERTYEGSIANPPE